MVEYAGLVEQLNMAACLFKNFGSLLPFLLKIKKKTHAKPNLLVIFLGFCCWLGFFNFNLITF